MRVAMVGLGVMGAPMARRLAAAGFEVVGYNRTRAKAQALCDETGMEVAESPREAAAGAAIVLSVLADNHALLDVAHGGEGILAGLGAGAVWVDFSTVSPALSVELSRETAGLGAARLEAPVSGSVAAVEAGSLVILVGGDEATLQSAQPVLRHLGRTERIGEVGQALALKLAINLAIPLQVLGFAEGLVLAERAGLERDRAIELMLGTVLASPMLKYRIPFAQHPPETPWFTVAMMLKDLKLALGEAATRDVPTPLTALAGDLLKMAVQTGFAQQEVASLVTMLEGVAGLAPQGGGTRP